MLWLLVFGVGFYLLFVIARVLVRESETHATRHPETGDCRPQGSTTGGLPSPENVSWLFHTKIAGVSHKNADGTDRQRIVARCHQGEWLMLVAEPDNPVDPNAIKVLRQNGEQLGYLKAELAADVASGKRGLKSSEMAAAVTAVTGGTRERPARGVNIVIGYRAPVLHAKIEITPRVQ